MLSYFQLTHRSILQLTAIKLDQQQNLGCIAETEGGMSRAMPHREGDLMQFWTEARPELINCQALSRFWAI
jgi:hypothetical protein